MNYSNLQNLLNEYEEKRNKAISLSNLKKENLYNQVSSLKDIDININKASVDKIRLILTTKNQNDIYIIDKHINLKQKIISQTSLAWKINFYYNLSSSVKRISILKIPSSGAYARIVSLCFSAISCAIDNPIPYPFIALFLDSSKR